jgi:hypothetical protein
MQCSLKDHNYGLGGILQSQGKTENEVHSLSIPAKTFQHTTRKFTYILKLISSIIYNMSILRQYHQNLV